MRIISRYVFREIVASALLGTLLATFVIFLQRVDRYFELLVRSSAKLETVGWLFALALPPVLPLTVPFGVLVGILIGLGRMSTDGEITAMRAAGVSSRAVIPPVITFALLAMLVAGASSLWLTPRAIRQSIAILNKLDAEQLTVRVPSQQFVTWIDGGFRPAIAEAMRQAGFEGKRLVLQPPGTAGPNVARRA